MSHKIECDSCNGHGETEGDHIQNCDVGAVGGCEICARAVDCRECHGYGEVDCDGDCAACEGIGEGMAS